MNPLASAVWDLVYKPGRSVEQRVVRAAELWREDPDECRYAAIVAFLVVNNAHALLGGGLEPPAPSDALLDSVGSDPTVARELGQETWNLMAKTHVAKDAGVIDPFLADDLERLAGIDGAASIFWFAWWATENARAGR